MNAGRDAYRIRILRPARQLVKDPGNYVMRLANLISRTREKPGPTRGSGIAGQAFISAKYRNGASEMREGNMRGNSI